MTSAKTTADPPESQSTLSGAQRFIARLARSLRRSDGAQVQKLILLAEALLSGRGEASGVAIAKELLAGYDALEASGRREFVGALASRFGCDEPRLRQAIARYTAQPGAATASELHVAAEPRRQELIRRLNLAPGGTAGVLRMREDVLAASGTDPALQVVDADFVHLLSSWFNRGFLDVRRMDWTTPAHILEKLIRYEAVHEITSWHDLQRRLAPPDRRCFAFFHPQLVDEPLIFVEVALTREIPDSIAPLLAENRRPLSPQRATTAVFYSISNCQPGLKGVSLGNFLIKQVVEELRRELPSLRQFVTLSPLPGFMQWLHRQVPEDGLALLSVRERDALAALELADWSADEATVSVLREPLLALAAQYLLAARNASGKPIDPVARFHLGNGARLERIDMLGDVSPKGLAQSASLMVNYLYDLPQIERNHEAFANAGEIVAAHAVRRLLRKPPAAERDHVTP
jgi:malonyl-CoA decarboxylase